MGRDDIDITAAFGAQLRKGKTGPTIRGKSFKVDFKVKPLIVRTDSKELAIEFADGLREIVRDSMRNVDEDAAPATIERRERANRNLGKGPSRNVKKKPRRDWYKWRYAGGRIGVTEPLPNRRKLFFDSGRMADNLVLRPRKTSSGESVVTMNVPGNRLSRESFARSSEYANMIRLLKEHVPILGKTQVKGADAARLTKTLNEIKKNIVANNLADLRKKRAKLRKQIFRALKAAASFARAA